MEKNQGESVPKNVSSSVTQHEDGILKVAMQFFAEEILPYFEIEGKVVCYAPTEIVQLELHKLFQDFNLIMEDGSWKHFEFQTTDGGIKDLKRFRMYEAVTSYQYDVNVTTYVLYSGKIKNPKIQFTEGVNTYCVKPIIMAKEDADEVIGSLVEKIQNGETITKADLIPVVLTPLMGGKSGQKERITAAFQITEKVTGIAKEDIQKIEAMVYAMADKFLNNVELEELKEGLKMTRLGAMLVNDGIEQGIERGIENVVKLCKDFGSSKEETILRVIKMFERNKEDAQRDVEKYW